MKVDVAVHGRFHGFDLAAGLSRRGLLGTLLTTYPRFVVRRTHGAGIPLRTAPSLEILRRMGQRTGLSRAADGFLLPRFGKFAASHLRDTDADVVVGWSSAMKEGIPVAKDRGITVVIDRGAAHILHQNSVLDEAYRACGLDFPGIPEFVIERELSEYEAADKIFVPSTQAAGTFVSQGIPREKVAVVPLGVDAGTFHPVPSPTDTRKSRILFVGAVGVQKGTPQLLRSFAPLHRDAELHLVGPVDPEFAGKLEHLPTDAVSLPGTVPKAQIGQAYADADIFCLPSVHEGFGMVVLEAMASGLPVVVSDQAGAADAVTHGEDGFVFPINDEEALTKHLNALIGDPRLRREMGAAAQKTARSGKWGWDGYIDRVVQALQSLSQG